MILDEMYSEGHRSNMDREDKGRGDFSDQEQDDYRN